MISPEVMLASAGEPGIAPEQALARLSGGQWSFEIKFDGIRAVANRDPAGRVRIFNRRQAEITHRYPDVVTHLEQASFVGWVDGEIITTDAQGRPDFAGAHLRDAQSSAKGVRAAMARHPATFVAFDVLEDAGADVRALPYLQRHERLSGMLETVSLASQDGATLWSFVQERGLEGLVAKRSDSAYRPGRQRAWQKIKLTHRISVLVCGTKPGQGSRGAIGALQMCLWNPATSSLAQVGYVGSGLSDAELTWMGEHIGSGAPIVIEVEYLEVSATGQLRSPVYRGRRLDVDPSDCTVDTLPVRHRAAS